MSTSTDLGMLVRHPVRVVSPRGVDASLQCRVDDRRDKVRRGIRAAPLGRDRVGMMGLRFAFNSTR